MSRMLNLVVIAALAGAALTGCAMNSQVNEFNDEHEPTDVITDLGLNGQEASLDASTARLLWESDTDRIFVAKGNKDDGKTCLVIAAGSDSPSVACTTGLPLESATTDGLKLYLSDTPPPKNEDWVQRSDSLWTQR